MLETLLRSAALGLLVASLTLPACTGDRPPGRDSVVDSAASIDTLLARFRSDLTPVDSLTDGAPSRDALVARFAEAVERRDTAAFRRLALTREEFAWLYYPLVPEAAPPYELEPGLMWFMIETNSGRGLRTLLDERGGAPLGIVDHRCEGERHHAALTIWGPCVVRRRQATGDTVTENLFGPIVSRDGRFKFVSYANRL